MNVLVVGAGVAGLAVAARLAATGHRVDVLERSGELGGFCQGYHRDGFGFDTGPSLLTWPEQLRSLFADTGGWPAGLRLVRLDPQVHYVFADGARVSVTGGSPADAFARGLGPAAGADWARLLDRGERAWRLVAPAVLTQPRPGLARLAGLAARHPGDLATLAPLRSLAALGGQFGDPRLAMVLNRYATYAGADPRRAPATLMVIAYLEALAGCWHVAGGLHRIPAALAERVRERGGRIHLRSEVVRITGSRRVTGVALADGRRLAADIVVTDVAAGLVRRLLGRPAGRPGTPSLSGFSMLLALRAGPSLPHHQVSFPPDYLAEFEDVFAGRPAADPAIYLCCPADPSLHPAGGRACRLLVNAPPQDAFDWTRPGVAEGYAAALLDRLATRGTDLTSRLLWRELRTPADLHQQTAAPGGAIYGRAPHGAAGLRRADNRGRLAGLFLVGGSVHPGGGLPLVLSSAAIVAGLIGPASAGASRRMPPPAGRQRRAPDR